MEAKSYECCILGAGPAGLAAAAELVKHGVSDIIIVDRNARVGGLSRTERYEDAAFDIGPHRFFNYPIKAFDTLVKLGPVVSLQVLASFALQQMRRRKTPTTFEQWVVEKSGHRLYEMFFKTYTEEVRGIPCSRIGPEWVQRFLAVMAATRFSRAVAASSRFVNR